MSFLLFIGFIFVLMVPLFRCMVFNLHNIGLYSIYDIFDYLIHKKWKRFKKYGIDMYVGMFGHGKTLSMTHNARKLYKKFGNSLLFVSNYKLFGIPYVPLINFNQLLDLGEEKPEHYSYREVMSGAVPAWCYDDAGNILSEYIDYEKRYYGEDENEYILVKMIRRWKFQGTVVLIDEIEDVLSHRNYANFPLQLLNVLTQQRKKHVYIMCSAQRFFMVDKLFRCITTHVIDCNKIWRFQGMKYYDAWDYENAMTPQLVKSKKNCYWFVKNKDFRCYSTEQMVSRTMSEDFISNDEKLSRIGLDNMVNDQAVQHPSFRLRRIRKKKAV